MKEHTLLNCLLSERASRNSNGIYHRLQIDFAYNSNHIEGSKLTHDQTKYIFETKTLDTSNTDSIQITDILETVNHFRCFDFLLDTIGAPLTEDYIKQLHNILKNGVNFANPDVVVGDYKIYPNEVGNTETAKPEEVSAQMQKLLKRYNKKSLCFCEVLDFHSKYEHIHPFYDGNGRTGRLLMFKQCLEQDIVPFIITDQIKMFYYRGLQQWPNGQKGYLIDTCLSAQDNMKTLLDYFQIDYDHKELTAKAVLAECNASKIISR